MCISLHVDFTSCRFHIMLISCHVDFISCTFLVMAVHRFITPGYNFYPSYSPGQAVPTSTSYTYSPPAKSKIKSWRSLGASKWDWTSDFCQFESAARPVFFIKILVFSLKKKSHSVILSFNHAYIYIQTPTNAITLLILLQYITI